LPGTEGPPQDRMPSPDREVLPLQALEKRTAPSSKAQHQGRMVPEDARRPARGSGFNEAAWRLGARTLLIAIVPGSLLALIVALFLMTFFAGR